METSVGRCVHGVYMARRGMVLQKWIPTAGQYQRPLAAWGMDHHGSLSGGRVVQVFCFCFLSRSRQKWDLGLRRMGRMGRMGACKAPLKWARLGLYRLSSPGGNGRRSARELESSRAAARWPEGRCRRRSHCRSNNG